MLGPQADNEFTVTVAFIKYLAAYLAREYGNRPGAPRMWAVLAVRDRVAPPKYRCAP
jgi:hypothetical protein